MANAYALYRIQFADGVWAYQGVFSAKDHRRLDVFDCFTPEQMRMFPCAIPLHGNELGRFLAWPDARLEIPVNARLHLSRASMLIEGGEQGPIAVAVTDGSDLTKEDYT